MTDDPGVLREIRLQPHHRPTGATRHYRGDKELPPPVGLQIVKYKGDPGYLLFYLDENGVEQSDTWHDSIEAALDQAEWEFNVRPDEWREGPYENPQPDH